MCDYDNSSRLRRCCFGTCTSTFAENDHLEAKLPPSIYCPVAKKKKNEHGDPPFEIRLFTHNRYTENILTRKKFGSRSCSIYI